ncbi:Zeta toxin/Type II/IV secretion system protein/Elongation factor Tu GTP binding domain/Septin/AIG1 family/50S ribosome-binding GTPase, putative [Entamoeba histolytica]
MSRVIVRFILNGQCIANKPLNSQDNLKIAREKIKGKMLDSQHFLTKDGDLIDVNDEESYTIGDVIDEKRIINIKGTEVKIGIRIKINDKVLTTIEIDNKTTINIIRTLVQNIPESAHFYTLDNDKIERDEEEEFTVEDIINNEEINLKEEKENIPEINDITIGICLNGKPLIKKQFNKTNSLSDVRKEIENVKQIPKDFVFEDLEGFKIPIDDEQSLKLTSILYNNKINITTEVTGVSEPSTTTSLLGSPNNSTIPGNSLTNSITSDISLSNNTCIFEPNIPIEGSIRLKSHEEGMLKIYLYPNEPFNQKDESDAIAILVVGQTGSGKTTLLNSFVNALYGIKITDDFRYIIINEDNLKQNKDQSISQTSQVTIYNIKRTKRTPPIKIIDTPGFGDTRGITWDIEITKQIKEAFETKVLDLNAICFVAPSSNVRLTASQKYIFGNIIDLFGKDVKKNFIAMLTFCDGKKPQVINALESKECIFSTIIPEIDNPWYLKFNNSAIYDDNTEDEFTQMFWKLGMKNFDDFITKLLNLPRISLEKSREVLKRRERIKVQLEGLRTSLNNGLSKLDEIKQIYEQFYLNRDKVKNNENFTFTVNITVQKKIDLERGEYVTNCLKCNKTCHYPCGIAGDVKDGCACIDNDYCNVCGCHYTRHANSKYRFDYVIEKEQQTAQEVLERYNEGKKGMASAESMLKKLEEDYYKIQMECYDKEVEIVECINTLSAIALNDKITGSNEYLDIMIQSENDEKKTGYKVRIEGYKQLKQANDIIEGIMKKSTTKKSKDEIKAELKRRKTDLVNGQKITLDKNCEGCVIC